MNILITGATGFVGKNLVPRLLQQGHHILELTRSIEKSEALFGSKTNKLHTSDEQFKEKIIAFGPEVVIHLASYLTSSDQLADVNKLVETNLLFLSKVLDAVAKGNLKLFINTGTFAEYFKGDGIFQPAYFYAATKTASRALVDYYALTYHFKQCTVVPYTIYGGNDSQKKIIDLIYDSTSSSSAIDLSPGEQVLDFIHVDDVTELYGIILNKIDTLPIKANFNLGTGVGHTLKDLAKNIEELTGLKTNINWGGKDYRPSDVMYAVADLTSMKEMLSWTPKISLKDGLVDFFKVKNN